MEKNIVAGNRETGIDQVKRLLHFFAGGGKGLFERCKNRIPHYFRWRHARSDRTGYKPRLHTAAAICDNNMVEGSAGFSRLLENLECTGDIAQTTNWARSAERTHVNVSSFAAQRRGALFRDLQCVNVPWNVMNERTKEAV